MYVSGERCFGSDKNMLHLQVKENQNTTSDPQQTVCRSQHIL